MTLHQTIFIISVIILAIYLIGVIIDHINNHETIIGNILDILLLSVIFLLIWGYNK